MPKQTLSMHDRYEKFLPSHYDQFPIEIVGAEGCRLTDKKGREYIDMLAGYAALNFGHTNPKLLLALMEQFQRVGLITGNFYNQTVIDFAERLVDFVGLPQSKALLMNTGAEAVEKAIKLCRRWGYGVKGIQPEQAEIIVTRTNFHGRTYGVLSASQVDQYRKDFGPFMSGFKLVKFNVETFLPGDLDWAINDNTAAFMVEPIQGEGGFIFPAGQYLKRAQEICRANNVLFVLDEIPTAFGRIGSAFPHFHYGLEPDMVILGKALGGGIYPVSAVVGRSEIMDLLGPGDDGSTFGGNPLAAAVGSMAITLTQEENLVEKTKTVGTYFIKELKKFESVMVKEVRGLGFFIGMELNEAFKAREVCWELIKRGIFTVPARGNVIRFTPPLTITKNEIDDALERMGSFFRTA